MVGFYVASAAVAVEARCSQGKPWGLSILKFGIIYNFYKRSFIM
jgi:hypothetical protein